MIHLLRSVRPLFVALLFVASISPLRACGPWIFSANDLNFYRIMPYWQEDKYTAQRSDFVSANCRLWAEQLGGGVSEQDVRAALYQTDYRDWKEFFAYHANTRQPDRQTSLLHSGRTFFGISISLPDNAFVKRIMETNDTVALDYIHLCKLYEEIRQQQLDPWYYSCGWDDNTATLDSIARMALAYNGSQYIERYLLLAVRSLCALRSDSECIQLWEEKGSGLPQNCLRSEMENYVAGSYLRTGQRDKAIEIFIRLGDIPSLVYILGSAEQVCELLYTQNPTNTYFPSTLQKFLYAMENGDFSDRYGQYEMRLDSVGRSRLLALCSRAMADSRVQDKAMWCYTAAAIHDRYGRPQQALQCLQNAESGCQDTFLCRSIRLFRCYLHVKIDTVDDHYEQYLLGELRWIDRTLQEEYASLVAPVRYAIERVDWLYSTDRNLYIHDAMRILLLGKGGACERLSAAGRDVRALQLANMAENRLFIISNNSTLPIVRTQLGKAAYTHVYRDWDNYFVFPYYLEFNPDSLLTARYVDTIDFNSHDYSNAAFMIADTMTASRLREFWQRTCMPQDEFDRFLSDKGYRDTNYWVEMIGTHHLREGDYYNAVSYLRQVSPDFVRNQNIKYYWDWNPFSYDRQPMHTLDNPKLAYAERMLWLERQIQREQDPDRLGQLLLDYFVGLRNATDRCWSLLSYGKTDGYWSSWNEYGEGYDPDWQQWLSPNDLQDPEHCWFNTRQCRREYLLLADQIQRIAFLTFRSEEALAQAYHQIGFYDRVRSRYPNTPTARWLENHCDTKAQWSANKKSE